MTATYSTTNGSQVIVLASSDVKADFMNLMGLNSLKVAVDSQVKWGNTKMRVALALDTTGSMSSDGKMDALKAATKSLLTTLKNAATTNGDVYVSIIPFSKSVNVGKSRYTENWIRWSGQSDTFDENNGDVQRLRQQQRAQDKKQVPGQRRRVDGNRTTTSGTAASSTATRITTSKTQRPTSTSRRRSSLPSNTSSCPPK